MEFINLAKSIDQLNDQRYFTFLIQVFWEREILKRSLHTRYGGQIS